MSKDKKQCVYCKAYLFEDDEVAVCPICGAPHHKECYNECGHCALSQYHGTDSEYNPHPENGDTETTDAPIDREGHTCRRCGKTSSSDTLFCPYCATPFSESPKQDLPYGQPQGAPFPNPQGQAPFMFKIDLLGGVDKKQKIDGLEAGDIASFVRVNTRRYIPLFAEMDREKKKSGWNWSAFLFPAAWNAYRKNYFAMGILAAVLLCSLYLVGSLVFALNSYLGQLPVGTELTPDILFASFSKLSTIHWVVFGVGIAMDMTSRIISALFGDYWYKERIIQKIKEIKIDAEIENPDEVLQRKGGVNQWLGLLMLYPSGMMIYQCGSLLMQILSWLMSGM